MAEDESANINDLPGPVLIRVFSLLTAADCAAVSCVQKSWHELANEDWLWEKYCQQDWMETSDRKKPDGEICSSFKVMYEAFHSDFARYGSLYMRAKGLWSKLKAWSAEHIPEIAESLSLGATESELDRAESMLGVKLPPAMRMLYRLHDGQTLRSLLRTGPYVHPSAFHGLLGGYNFYDHQVNTRLLPLKAIVMWSERMHSLLEFPAQSQRILIAASFNLRKFVFLDCSDGLIYIGTRQLRQAHEMVRCVPDRGREQDSASSSSVEADLVKTDGLLRWLEEYSNRLESGMYAVHGVDEGKTSYSICLYPELPPLCTTAVTRRVQVRASAVFVPEMCVLSSPADDRHYFSYSIRLKLLPRSDSQPGPRDQSVQLRRRHWIIKDREEIVGDIEGEAVIGLYPLLKEDDTEEFVYQSCSGQLSSEGSIEGEFLFAPGSLQYPTGDDFAVHVPRFPLIVPDFVF